MGRRKKKTWEEQSAADAALPENGMPNGVRSWETAIYARLSVENSKKDDGGASIEEQVAICEEYIAEHPYLHLYKTYIDNGWTGTNIPTRIEISI